LNDGLVDRYVKRRKRHGTQRNILASVNILWNFAKEKRLMGDTPGLNPTSTVILKKPTQSEMKLIAERYL